MKTQAMSTSAQWATTFNTIWLWWNILVTLTYTIHFSRVFSKLQLVGGTRQRQFISTALLIPNYELENIN